MPAPAVLQAILDGESAYALTLRLTLVLVLLYGSTSLLLDVPIRVICGAMLVVPALLGIAYLWWVLVAFLCAGNLLLWYQIDNHKYLITYWVASCAISLGLSELQRREECLRSTARWLVGCVFAFATLWKLVAGEYLNGVFFEYTMLSDARLESVASLVSGIAPAELALGRDALAFMRAVPITQAELPLRISGALGVFAFVLSGVTLAVEGLVAATHLIGSPRMYGIRHTVLVVFIAGTYFLLPVIGFAFVLSILGFAETRESDRARRLVYLVLFAFVHLTLIPWQGFLRTFL